MKSHRGVARHPAHLDDLSGITLGGFQYLFSEIVDLEITKAELANGHFEQLACVGSMQWFQMQRRPRVPEQPPERTERNHIARWSNLAGW